MLRPVQILLRSHRHFASKIKKSVLLQDTDQIPTFEYPRSKASDRRVYVWGLSETGALGVQKSLKKQSSKHTAFIQHPTRLQFAETLDIVDIACGYGFSAFAVRRDDGISLFGTGLNTESQLGYHKRGGENNQPLELVIYPAPIWLPKLSENQTIQIRACAAGRAHLLALSEDNYVYALGNNAYGQCGRTIISNEKYAENQIPHIIQQVGMPEEAERIASIYCGQDHSIFITETGSVFSCGWGADGQTGLGHYNSVGTPTRVTGDIASEKIVKVAGTVDCVLVLNDKGEVFGWGNSEYGQLETFGDTQQICKPQFISKTKGLGKIVDIAAGGSFCMILNENGDVFIWGYGILGLGPNVDQCSLPKQIPATLFGRNEFNPNSRVQSISCGISHMAAITHDRDLYMWGHNKFGCLGLGHKNDQMFPFKAAVGGKVIKVQCAVDHTIALCQPFM